MKKKIFELGIALVIALAFAAGWLAARFYDIANPPDFKILEDFHDEVSLIRFTNFEYNILSGSYEGKQPRFLLGNEEKIVIPKDGKIKLNLESI